MLEYEYYVGYHVIIYAFMTLKTSSDLCGEYGVFYKVISMYIRSVDQPSENLDEDICHVYIRYLDIR